ncbi:LAGLIDADG-like domain protein [uncultured archaeon]|nr:LAGLIDADG-like domain protein [uncultured archaeon]
MPAEKIIDFDHELLSQINEIRKNGNFQTVKKTIGEEKIRQFINSMYPNFSITEIEAMTGIPDSTLEHWFKLLKISPIRNHIATVSIPSNTDAQTIITQGLTTKKVSSIKITPKLAYVIGFTLGDGSVQKYMVEVFNKDKALRRVLFDYLTPYGSITQDERPNGLWRLRLSNGKIANLIRDEKGIRQDTLDFIFKDETLARNFIAAFWDAEGAILKKKDRKNYCDRYLYNSNKYLIDKICKFLEKKEIKYPRHIRSEKERVYYLNGRQVKSNKPLHRISIPSHSRLKWINEIGLHMRHSKKRETITKLLEFYSDKYGK